MSENVENSFSGFMPTIDQINLSGLITMINTEGDLVSGHVLSIKSKDGSDHIFSISDYDLMRLAFLITKIINSN